MLRDGPACLTQASGPLDAASAVLSIAEAHGDFVTSESTQAATEQLGLSPPVNSIILGRQKRASI